ncbi:MAG: sugar transferase [Janthinobacterium lividum]
MKTPIYSKTSLKQPEFKEPKLKIVSLPAAELAERDTDTVLFSNLSSSHTAARAMQRGCDVLFCTIALLLLWPAFAVIAVLIRLDSPGPVLFKQSRVGKDGVEFWFYKFRSMVTDAEAQRHLLEMQNERSGPVFKMKNDPRITRVGRVLRKFSLDELPQLINVIKGDMSLVGPRPALPKETDKYTDRQRQRLICLPGVTGLWQVSGRASLSFERSIELDLYYIERQSIVLYFRILLLTIPAVLRAEGAY